MTLATRAVARLRRRRARRRRPSLAVTIALLALILVSLLPMLRVIAPGGWAAATIVLVVVVLATGHLARLARLPGAVTIAAELAVGVVGTTILALPSTALGGILPTRATIEATAPLVTQAVDDIRSGSAPLAASPALAFVMIAAVGALAVVIDQVAIGARAPLAAALPLLAVSLVPAVAVPTGTDAAGVCVFLGVLVVMLRTERRTRERDAAGRRTCERDAAGRRAPTGHQRADSRSARGRSSSRSSSHPLFRSPRPPAAASAVSARRSAPISTSAPICASPSRPPCCASGAISAMLRICAH